MVRFIGACKELGMDKKVTRYLKDAAGNLIHQTVLTWEACWSI